MSASEPFRGREAPGRGREAPGRGREAPGRGREALAEPLLEHRRCFLERFGEGGDVRLFFSPGRVNLVGAHLDYNGGPVMPVAIDRGTFLAVRQRDDGRLRFDSMLERGLCEFELARLPERASDHWSDYPLGVVRRMLAEAGGAPGADVLFGGNLSIGAGLSSSASICVGTAYALGRLWGMGLELEDCIAAALWGEREFVGVRCGIMDPYAVGLTRPGHLLWLDCKDVSIDHVPLDPEGLSIAVADTRIRRSLAEGAFNERVAECRAAYELLAPRVPGASCLRDVPRAAFEEHAAALPAHLARRARHVVEEVERAFAARAALAEGDLAGFGATITEAHRSLRELFEVSVPELDVLVDAAVGCEGVHGARLTGAGFGGCVVVAMRSDAREGFVAAVERAFQDAFGRRPAVEFYSAAGGPFELGR